MLGVGLSEPSLQRDPRRNRECDVQSPDSTVMCCLLQHSVDCPCSAQRECTVACFLSLFFPLAIEMAPHSFVSGLTLPPSPTHVPMPGQPEDSSSSLDLGLATGPIPKPDQGPAAFFSSLPGVHDTTPVGLPDGRRLISPPFHPIKMGREKAWWVIRTLDPATQKTTEPL